MVNGRAFDEFESGDFKQYQNRLLIWYLDGILTIKGKLTEQDLKNVEENSRVLSQHLELIFKNWCFLRKSGGYSGNTSKCCLAQIGDAHDLERDAVELAHSMKAYIAVRLYDEPDDTRLQIIDKLRNVFTTRSEEEFTSVDISTFPRFFQVLGIEMNAIDELMSGKYFKKLKPALEFLLRKRGPRIVLKFKKYYENSTLGYDECLFCNSYWEQEPDIKNVKYVPCFKTPENLECFLALRFRQSFYAELRDFLPAMDHYFSDGFEK